MIAGARPNAAGGIVVGLVTKYAGSVKKGFALIFGLLLLGIIQAIMSKDGDGGKISIEHVVGGCLAGLRRDSSWEGL
jgi:UDP-sugar transporter A1/2/3